MGRIGTFGEPVERAELFDHAPQTRGWNLPGNHLLVAGPRTGLVSHAESGMCRCVRVEIY